MLVINKAPETETPYIQISATSDLLVINGKNRILYLFRQWSYCCLQFSRQKSLILIYDTSVPSPQADQNRQCSTQKTVTRGPPSITADREKIP